MRRRLYIEYRVELDPQTNQDLVHDIAEAVKDKLYDTFETDSEIHAEFKDVTYEVVMVVEPEVVS
jgi:divalent metal cation (Fe/Co/Zn/Cd) transporter